MRVLICASSAPLAPMNGFRLLLAELVAKLRDRHDVMVVAPRHPEQRPVDDPWMRLAVRPAEGRLRSAAQLPVCLARRRPLSDDRVANALWPRVAEELHHFSPDVVHVTSGRLAVLGARLGDRPSLLAAVDARHLNVEARAAAASGPMRMALRDEARRVRATIRAEYRRFGHVTVVTEQDRAALLAIDPGLTVSVVPNGVDVEAFRPSSADRAARHRVVFTGSMAYVPNVTAARFLALQVLPRLRRQLPDATLVIVGRDPTPAVTALGGAPGVTVTGEVPDIRPWLTGSQVFAAPMSTGTGIKNKVLEAMACGVPCVVSPLALQGIAATNGQDVLVAEPHAAEFAAALVRVLRDDRLASRLGRRARAHVVDNHSWDAAAGAHERIYERLIADHGSAASARGNVA
jgi:polysaccharide biosynthesis protein PslH